MRNVAFLLASLLWAIPAWAQDAGLQQFDVLTGDVTRVAPGRVVYEADVLNTCAAAANVRFSATPPGVGGMPMARSSAAIAPQATRTFSYAETVDSHASGTTTGEVYVTDKPTETVITESPGVCKTVTTQCKAQPNFFSWTVLVQAAETRAPSGVRLKLRTTLAETRTERPTPCPPPASTEPQVATTGLEYPVTPIPGANPGTGVDEDDLFGGEADRTPWYMNKWILTGVAATGTGIVIGTSGGGSGSAPVTGQTPGASPPATTGTPTTGTTNPAPVPAPAPLVGDPAGIQEILNCMVVADNGNHNAVLQFCSQNRTLTISSSRGGMTATAGIIWVQVSGSFDEVSGLFDLTATGPLSGTNFANVAFRFSGRIDINGNITNGLVQIGGEGLPGRQPITYGVTTRRQR